MKNMKRSILTSLLALFLVGFASAQNFIRLTDASGITPTTEELSSIETAVQQAVDILPTADRPLFKVYDAGFYIHNIVMIGGIPPVWEQIKTDVENLPSSEYYLIFGRESSSEGLNTKVRVKLKLPTTSAYSCLTEEERGNLERYIEQVANDNLSFRYTQAEVAALELLKDYLYKIIVCNCSTVGANCTQFNNFSFLDVQLRGLGFRKKEIQLGGDCAWSNGDQGIYDYFGKQVIIDGISYCITEEIHENKAIIEETTHVMEDTTMYTSVTGKVYILDNQSFTNGEWETAKTAAATNDFVEYWVVLTNNYGKSFLYSRFIVGGSFPAAAKGDSTANRLMVPTNPWGIALNALGNAAIDALIQTIGLRILDKDARSQPAELDRWLKAWEKVDKFAAAWEGISSLIPWKKAGELQGAVLRAATSGIAVVIDRATSPSYPNYTVKDGLLDFTITFGTSALTQIIAQKFNLSSGPRLISEGLDNWYFGSTGGTLKKIIFHVSKVYDDFKNGVVHAGKYWENSALIQGVKKIDLMGGTKSQIGGDFINVDFSTQIQKGIRGDATALSKFIPENSIDEIVCTNPFLGQGLKAEDYIKEVAKVIKSGKKVYINGTMSNPFYNKVNQSLAAQYGFAIETFQQPLLQQFQFLKFFQTNGNPIGIEFMRTTVLIKQ
jgi:hypothetical protein